MATYTFGSRWMRVVDFASGTAMGVMGVGLAAAAVAGLRECAAILAVCVLSLAASAHPLLRPYAATVDGTGAVSFHRVLWGVGSSAGRVESICFGPGRFPLCMYAWIACRGHRLRSVVKADPRDLYDFAAAVAQHDPDLRIHRYWFAWFLARESSLAELRALAAQCTGPLWRL